MKKILPWFISNTLLGLLLLYILIDNHIFLHVNNDNPIWWEILFLTIFVLVCVCEVICFVYLCMILHDKINDYTSQRKYMKQIETEKRKEQYEMIFNINDIVSEIRNWISHMEGYNYLKKKNRGKK